jgi:ribosome-associated protein
MSNNIDYIDFSDEFEFKTSRSSGPGGQHVNKTETRVTLRFNVAESKYLTQGQKDMILIKLSGQINSEGELLIHSEETRSQLKNKEICVHKFYELLAIALKKEKKRIPTKPSKSSMRKRVEDKKKNAEKKARRRNPDWDR